MHDDTDIPMPRIDIDEVLRHSVRKEPTHFLPAEGPAVLCGALIDIDDQTNRTTGIERVLITE